MTETKVLAEKTERMVCELVAAQMEETRLAVVAAVTRGFATRPAMSAPRAARKRSSNRKPRVRRELHRPMSKLKDAGRVRSVGERHRTRSFPAVTGGTEVGARAASASAS